jgi:hypothetical protein
VSEIFQMINNLIKINLKRPKHEKNIKCWRKFISEKCENNAMNSIIQRESESSDFSYFHHLPVICSVLSAISPDTQVTVSMICSKLEIISAKYSSSSRNQILLQEKIWILGIPRTCNSPGVYRYKIPIDRPFLPFPDVAIEKVKKVLQLIDKNDSSRVFKGHWFMAEAAYKLRDSSESHFVYYLGSIKLIEKVRTS